jgi:hypothetical protein
MNKEAIWFLVVLLLASMAWAIPTVTFVNPTPVNDYHTNDTSVVANVSITTPGLQSFGWDWNGMSYGTYDDSLILMMNFDNVSAFGENDTHAVDVSRYGNNGTTVGGVSFDSSGRYGGDFVFPGAWGNGIVVPNSPTLKIPAGGNVTMCAWVYYTAMPGTWQELMAKRDPSTSNTAYGINMHQGDVQVFGGGAYSAFGVTLSVYQWMFICGEINPAVAQLYINGTLVGTGSGGGGVGDNDANLYIGAWRDEDTYGKIDEVRIWNRTLSADEIQEAYMSNLNKYSSTHWDFYINQTKSPGEGLDNGTYIYQPSASDGSGDASVSRRIFIGAQPVSFVPEFGTWALLLALGLVAAGVISMRRR